MTLPVSPNAISLSNVDVELGLLSTATITMNDTAVRTLFVKPSGTISMGDGWGKSVRTYATWNPARNSGSLVSSYVWTGAAWVWQYVGWALSNGNLTAQTAGTNNGYAELECYLDTTIYKAPGSGKWYCELYVQTQTYSLGFKAGLMNSSHTDSTALGDDVNSESWNANNGSYKWNSGTLFTAASWPTSGMYLGFAMDRSGAYSTNTVYIYKNGVLQGSAAIADANALSIALGNPGWTTNTVITANFGASAFTYAPPAGYNAGIYN